MVILDTTVLLLYAAVLFTLSIYGLHRWHLLWLARRHAHADTRHLPLQDPLPRVTVQLPVYNERFVIRRLLRAVCQLDYPKDRLEIQILDDSTDSTTRLIARMVARARRRGFDMRHLHRRQRVGFKAGALAAGHAVARGEFLAIFDSDFVPPPHFLKRALPPFADPRVGMVQARWSHINRGRSLLTRLQAIFLDGHFLVEHLARNRSGRYFNFNGTAGVWRRACIDEAGGWQHQTLTEDLDLSYRAQLRGWRFVFLPDLLAPAELPGRMTSFKSQQHRWSKGSVQTARKLLWTILTSPVPIRVRLEAGFHLTENLAYPLMACLALLLWPSIVIRQRLPHHLFFSLDLLVFLAAWLSVAAFYLYSQREAGRRPLESLLAIPALMGLGIGLALNNSRAVIEALAGHSSPFVRTPKDGRVGNRLPSPTSAAHPRRIGYRSVSGVMPFLECLFALYFAIALVDVTRRGLWAWLPFLVLFFWGFAFTAATSLAEAWRGEARQS